MVLHLYIGNRMNLPHVSSTVVCSTIAARIARANVMCIDKELTRYLDRDGWSRPAEDTLVQAIEYLTDLYNALLQDIVRDFVRIGHLDYQAVRPLLACDTYFQMKVAIFLASRAIEKTLDTNDVALFKGNSVPVLVRDGKASCPTSLGKCGLLFRR